MFNTSEFGVAGVEQGKRMVRVDIRMISRGGFIQHIVNHGEEREHHFKYNQKTLEGSLPWK